MGFPDSPSGGVLRGFYGGAVGYFAFGGAMDTAIAIRSVLMRDGRAYVQAGAGIVADSDPEAEHRECHLGLPEFRDLWPGPDVGQVRQSVIGEHVLHALARALAPKRDDNALVGCLQCLDVLDHRLEHVGVRFGAFGCKIPPLRLRTVSPSSR
mgnify:CR=1 FL=1